MTIAYPRERVEDVLLDAPLPPSVRIFPTRHRFTPKGVGPSDSRFAGRADPYSVLYAAPDFATAFVEVVIRDRFAKRVGDRSVHLAELRNLSFTVIRSGSAVLRWLDLRDDGCLRLGAPTDAVRARHNAAGRALARSIHARHPDIDGILFPGRLTGFNVYAVFDRALGRVEADTAAPLATHPDLPDALRRYDIWIDHPKT